MSTIRKTNLKHLVTAVSLVAAVIGVAGVAQAADRAVLSGSYAAGDAYKGQAWEPTALPGKTLKARAAVTFQSAGQGEPAADAVVYQARAFDFSKYAEVKITMDGPKPVNRAVANNIVLR